MRDLLPLSVLLAISGILGEHVPTVHAKRTASRQVQREVQPARVPRQALPAEAGVFAPVAGHAVSANPVLTHESSKSSRAADGHLGALSVDVPASSSSLNMRQNEARRESR